MKLLSNSRRVLVSARDVADFNSQWPCAGIPERACFFEFDRSGNLCDMSEHLCSEKFDGDGSALSALSHDAQAHMESETVSLMSAGLHPSQKL